MGAVVVHGGRVVGRAHNLRETTQDPTAHAELLAVQRAAEHLGSWRLEDTTVYVTLEPCTMFVGAIVQARVARVVYGAREPKTGAIESAHRLFESGSFNHQPAIDSGILAGECSQIITRFFEAKRRHQK